MDPKEIIKAAQQEVIDEAISKMGDKQETVTEVLYDHLDSDVEENLKERGFEITESKGFVVIRKI